MITDLLVKYYRFNPLFACYYKMAADKGNKFGKEYVEDAAWFKNFYKQQTIN